MTKASQKVRPNYVEKWDKSKCRNETKASGKIRRSTSTKTSQKTIEVEDLRSRETKAAKRRVGQQRDLPKKITKNLPKFISLPNHNGNQHPIWVEVVDGETNFKRGDDGVKNASYQQAKSPPGGSLPRHTEKSTKKSTEKSTSQVLLPSQKLTVVQSTESTEKSTGKVYQVDQMVTEADFQSRLPSQAASGSQCHLPMTTAWEIFHKALHQGSRECRHAWTW